MGYLQAKVREEMQAELNKMREGVMKEMKDMDNRLEAELKGIKRDLETKFRDDLKYLRDQIVELSRKTKDVPFHEDGHEAVSYLEKNDFKNRDNGSEEIRNITSDERTDHAQAAMNESSDEEKASEEDSYPSDGEWVHKISIWDKKKKDVGTTNTNEEKNTNAGNNINSTPQMSARTILTRLISSRLSMFDRSHEVDEEFPATIHGYTIYLTMKQHWAYAWLALLTSLAIVSSQVVILNTVANDLIYYRPCTLHTDCPVGRFCGNPFNWIRDYCHDCQYDELATDYEYDTVSGLYFKNSGGVIYDEINCTSVVNSVPGWDHGYVDYKYIIFNKTIVPDRNQELCLQHLYCTSTNTMEGTCDNYLLNRNILTRGVLMTLIVCGFLGLGSSLLNEIEEARTEEKILIHALKQYSPLGILSWIPAQMIFILTRIRCYILPFSAAFATTGIMLSDTLSVEHVTLHILFITFIIELDDMAGALTLSPHMRNSLNRFFNVMKEEEVHWKVSYLSELWSRVVSITPVVIMVLHVYFSNSNCGTAFDAIYQYASYTCLLIKSLSVLYVHTTFDAFVWDLFRNSLAILWDHVIYYVTDERTEAIETRGIEKTYVIVVSCVAVAFSIMLSLSYFFKKGENRLEYNS